MAIFEPTFEQILSAKIKPEPGELHLLNFLAEVLPDEYEVFFQPFINGDKPDIIIMKRDAAVMIIEVKDWNLDNYYINKKTNWCLKRNDSTIKSPLSQVFHYKQSLFDIHDQTLFSKSIFNSKFFSIIICAVYFHNAETEAGIRGFLEKGHEKNDKYNKFLKYNVIIGRNDLTKNHFGKLLEKHRFNKRSIYFDSELYHSFRRLFKAPFHYKENGIEIRYTLRQKKLSESKPGLQKIKGVAGSGKTLILAKRAVNAFIRTKERVLILTYNITLLNYIHDHLSRIKEDFSWNVFYINNYHNFINSTLNKLGIPIDIPEELSYEEEKSFFDNFFADRSHFQAIENKDKFEAIFIDEVQDWDIRWLNIIKDFFLAQGGEFVVFGDEKQNIFHRELDIERKILTNIPGRWNDLKESFRLSFKISELATDFQIHFFSKKYQIDRIVPAQKERGLIGAEDQLIEYEYIKEGYAFSREKFIDIIFEKLMKHEINNNDVCIMAAEVELLRIIEKQIEAEKKMNISSTFETDAEFREIDKDNSLNLKYKKKKMQKLRKNKKYHFWMNSGRIKLATIHSFKGWEIHTLFLIIENDKNGLSDTGEEFISDELIYTALTRCRNYLFIININNQKYHNFFKNNPHTKNNF